jgi:PTH1 family peptidyl-tRNA hydrolase
LDALAGLLGALSAEAHWLADGEDARFVSDVALRMQE